MAEENYSEFCEQEATGVYKGILVEDMITTVQNTGKMYCNVYIPDFYFEDGDHPYTYVPLWAMTLPLKKDDVVWVKFHQDDLRYPVLWKLDSDVDTSLYEQFDTSASVQGGNVSSVEAQPTVEATRFGDGSFVIKTENYTLIRQDSGFILIDVDGNIYQNGKKINAVASDGICLDSGKKIQLFAKDKIQIKNDLYSLFTILSNMLNILNTSLATQGSPGAHTVVPNQFQACIQQLNGLMEE